MSDELITPESFTGRVVMNREQARDLGTYERMKSEASKYGVPLEILAQSEYDKARGETPASDSQPDADGIVTTASGERVYPLPKDEARNIANYELAKRHAAAHDATVRFI